MFETIDNIAYTVLPFLQFPILINTRFSMLSTECISIEYHFRPDNEISGFQKLAVNKWTCRKK